MHDPDDDFLDAPHVRALRAPALPGELDGEDAALGAFRRSVPGRRRRRRTVRLATGGSALVIVMGVTGGVAAAYPSTLPGPVQNAFHRVLGPVGVPAAPLAAPRQKQPLARPTHQPTRAAHPSQRPHPAVVSRVSASPRAAAPAAPAALPLSSPSPPAARAASPTASPSPSPAARPTLSATASRRVVPVHQGLQLRGLLTRDGQPIGGRTVYAAVYDAGGSSWRQVAKGQTAEDGSVSLHVGPLVRSSRVRLATQAVATTPIAITVVPRLTATMTRSSDGNRYAVDVSADGGAAGDSVVLQRYDGASWVRVAAHQLGDRARTRFSIAVPTAPTRYRVRLAVTRAHGAAGIAFTAQP
jgi:hypothetical protein